MAKRLKELQLRMARLLQKLDNYGYSREETLEELNSEKSDIEPETLKEYFDLKSRIDERLNYSEKETNEN